MTWLRSHLWALLLVGVAVFAPIKGIIITTVVLVFVDLVLGVLAARKRGDPLTSSGLKRTVIKLLVYEVMLMLAFLAETYVMEGALPMVKIGGGFVGLVEFVSCLENLNEISGTNLLGPMLAKVKTLQNKSDPE